jgi:glycosyltransferase involved in cell wall biosynthesis
VIEGRNGWLVDPGAVVPLAAALQSALATPGRLETMGNAGREIVERTFSWTVVRKSLVELFESLRA